MFCLVNVQMFPDALHFHCWSYHDRRQWCFQFLWSMEFGCLSLPIFDCCAVGLRSVFMVMCFISSGLYVLFCFDFYFVPFFLLLRCFKCLFWIVGPIVIFNFILELSLFIFCWVLRPWMDSFKFVNHALLCWFRWCDGIF